jgi:hypothetical protein
MLIEIDLNISAARCASGALALLTEFIGFPDRLFRLKDGAIDCVNTGDPLFEVFYKPHVTLAARRPHVTPAIDEQSPLTSRD